MKYPLNRLRRRSQHTLPEINLTPLIDTALTLLIIFMVATPMLKQENALQVELPRGDVKEVEDTQKQDIVISLDKSGKYFLNSAPVEAKNIIERIKFTVGQKGDQTVFVKADTSVHYGKVIQLVDEIKQVGGVRYVALATTKTS